MTTELTYLALAAALTALLWIPYIHGLATNHPLPVPARFSDPTPPPDLPAWVKRANRVHLNAVETLVPFATLVLILHVTEQNTAMTAIWAAVFFWSRVAHAIVMWAAIPFLRTIAVLAGLVATLALFVEAIW